MVSVHGLHQPRAPSDLRFSRVSHGCRSARRQLSGLIDLACATLAGEALASSDDFFAGMDNLVKPEPAIFLPDEYTERGECMDGWESRRKRTEGPS